MTEIPERNLEDDRSDEPHGPTCGCRECEKLTERTVWPKDDSGLLIDASDPDEVADDARADWEEWALENGGHRCECGHVVELGHYCHGCEAAPAVRVDLNAQPELPGADDGRHEEESGR